MIKIDSLTPGAKVVLHFEASNGFEAHTETAIFTGIVGEGDNRVADFVDTAGNFPWSAYRFKGHWCYGTSADRLRLLAVGEANKQDIDRDALITFFGRMIPTLHEPLHTIVATEWADKFLEDFNV